MEQNWNSYPWNKNVKSMFETANCQFLVSITSKCFSYACNHQSSLAVLAMWIPWLSFIVLKKEYEKTYDRLFQSKLAISNGSSVDFSQNWHLWCVLLSSFVLYHKQPKYLISRSIIDIGRVVEPKNYFNKVLQSSSVNTPISSYTTKLFT